MFSIEPWMYRTLPWQAVCITELRYDKDEKFEDWEGYKVPRILLDYQNRK